MQGNILVNTVYGSRNFLFNQENQTAILSQLTEDDCQITKLEYANLCLQHQELDRILNALKSNRSVSEIKFDHCELDSQYLENGVRALVDLPIKALQISSSDKKNSPETKQEAIDPRNLVHKLLNLRNYCLRNIAWNDTQMIHHGLDINRKLDSWHPSDTNLYDLNRFIASYYLALAIQFDKHNQYQNAMNFAVYGNLMLKQIPAASKNMKDNHMAAKIATLLGELHLKNDTGTSNLSEQHLKEAEGLEQSIPEQERNDDNWRNLLNINTLLAKTTCNHEKLSDTSNSFQHVISGLTCYFHLKEKTYADYEKATEAAKLISNIGNVTAAFIYHAIFDKNKISFNFNERMKDVKAELCKNEFEKIRDLFIDILIFMRNEHNSLTFSSHHMKEYLTIPENKQLIEKTLIDLTILDKYKEPTTVGETMTENTTRKSATTMSFYSYFFGDKNRNNSSIKVQNDEKITVSCHTH